MIKSVLIFGGAGFIGFNAAQHFLEDGKDVIIYDNLSRPGSGSNIERLQKKFEANLEFIEGDIRDSEKVNEVVTQHSQVDLVLHLAGQVAVTTSVSNPREDFEVNALGTFNILEALREASFEGAIIYSSTNKVYGRMENVPVEEGERSYKYSNLEKGVPETQNLDFHSPYGCSKGSADQYVLDYSRIYDLDTIVFRQSCIYGPNQFGIEDQGWVAWFTIASIFEQPLTIFGDGKQVRDVLYIDDLVEAFKKVANNIDKTRGEAYNIGGGPEYKLSLLELISILEEISGQEVKYSFDDWRPGDQRVYVSDIRKAEQDFGWKPNTAPRDGVKELYRWVEQNRHLLREAEVLE